MGRRGFVVSEGLLSGPEAEHTAIIAYTRASLQGRLHTFSIRMPVLPVVFVYRTAKRVLQFVPVI
jgi:hypothetical protein